MQIATFWSGQFWGNLVLCGRFTLRAPVIDLGQLFFATMGRADMDPVKTDPVKIDSVNMDSVSMDLGTEFKVGPARFNIAPTQNILCLHHDLQRDHLTAAHHRWGLIPAWAKDIAIGARMINARSETLDSKPSFKRALARRRCVIPMDGYYEWTKTAGGEGKQPFLIEPVDGQVKFMAGLWEENQQLGDGGAIHSCTIITTPANSTTAHVHQRMPAFLRECDFSAWLDPQCHDASQLKTLLRPAERDLLKLTAVSCRVNSPRNEDEKCVLPLDDVAGEAQQFIQFD
ncbi:MAG: SOS response-associated peptidase [Rubripirellula sp.]